MILKFDDIHVGLQYLYGDFESEKSVTVLALNRSSETVIVEVDDPVSMKDAIKTVHPAALRPMAESVPVYSKTRKRVIRPIETVEVSELSAADDIKDALSGLARDLSEDGADDKNEDDFDDDGDAAPHEPGTVDKTALRAEFSELLHDLGFDMGEIEMRPDSVEFKGKTVGFLWGMLSGIDSGEFPEEE